MNNGENIGVETIAKICNALGCNFDDVMEVVPDDKE